MKFEDYFHTWFKQETDMMKKTTDRAWRNDHVVDPKQWSLTKVRWAAFRKRRVKVRVSIEVFVKYVCGRIDIIKGSKWLPFLTVFMQ